MLFLNFITYAATWRDNHQTYTSPLRCSASVGDEGACQIQSSSPKQMFNVQMFFSHQWHAVKKLIVLSALWSKLTEVIRWRGNQRRGHPVAPTPKSWWLYVHDSQAHSRMRRSQQRSEINLKSRQMSSAFSLVLISGFSYMALQTRWTRVTKHKRCVSAQMKCSSSGYFCFSGRLKGALKIPKITRLNTSHWNTRSTDLSD